MFTSVISVNAVSSVTSEHIAAAETCVNKVFDDNNTQLKNYLFGGLEVTKSNYKEVVVNFLRQSATESVTRLNKFLESGRTINTEELADELFSHGGHKSALVLALSGIITVNDLTISGQVLNLKDGVPADEITRASVIDSINDDSYLLKLWVVYASYVF